MEPNASSTKPSTGRHAQEARRSILPRVAVIVLVIGAVIAIALALGPVWVVRAGVAVAIIAGIVAIAVAFKDLGRQQKELRQQKIEAERRLVTQAREHGTALTNERQRNGEVVSSLRKSHADTSERLKVSRKEAQDGQVRIVELNGKIGKLNSELSSLRGNNAALRQDLRERGVSIDELTRRLEDAESELAELRSGEVVSMPRHAQEANGGSHVWEKLPTAEELWADGNYPTVVDLQKLAFPVAESEPRRKHA